MLRTAANTVCYLTAARSIQRAANGLPFSGPAWSHGSRPMADLIALTTPTSLPTMVAFGGDNLGGLFLTTVSNRFGSGIRRQFLGEQRPADEPLAGRVFRCDVGAQGLPEPRFVRSPSSGGQL